MIHSFMLIKVALANTVNAIEQTEAVSVRSLEN